MADERFKIGEELAVPGIGNVPLTGVHHQIAEAVYALCRAEVDAAAVEFAHKNGCPVPAFTFMAFSVADPSMADLIAPDSALRLIMNLPPDRVSPGSLTEGLLSSRLGTTERTKA